MIVPSSTRSWLGILKFSFLTNSSCQVFLLPERIVSYKYGVLIRLTYITDTSMLTCILFGVISVVKNDSASLEDNFVKYVL